MATARIKQEPLDEEEAKTTSRKRARDDEPPPEGQPPAIRIKHERDLFEPPEDEDSSHTTFTGNAPADTVGEPNSTPAAETQMDTDDPATASAAATNDGENSSGPSSTTPTTGAVPLTNFFQFSDAAPNPVLEQTVLEKKVSENVLGPKIKLPKVAHYNAHDEVGEVQYISDHQANAQQHIDDHTKIVSIRNSKTQFRLRVI